ncbi:MAG: DUF3618 domain-containing protein [Gaiellaceae bacterium]
MAHNGRSTEDIRRDIETERTELAEAVESLRTGIGEAADVTGKLRAKLPIATAAALGAGFFLAGGIGATARLIFRRGREGSNSLRLGRFVISDRD